MEQVIECHPGKILEVLYEKEMWSIQKQWMATFAKNSQGANTKAYKWHTFSAGCYPSSEGEKARELYNNHSAHEYYIMANDDELVVLTDLKPETVDLLDYYVFPKNMAWCMAFTHEEGWLGPYFAKHPDYEKLNIDNQKQIEKEKQKAFAKSKGWT
ncbi:DUF4275 family protein [Microbulbifer sp. MLAF003]|uniref:DUF4275 family protein n=1 Tax=unclassified Microbulbifer TaxID=2619833 RepID=UPI0024AD11F0|nr:DUF4275 family protein [Microbulbifer sp. MLAF003]WHI50480.1 DUF4275 family protein [Microbulbifer sp. MLAF003]